MTGIRKLNKGLVLSLLLAVTFLLFFYHHLLLHPGSVFLSTSGDGLQAYYSDMYHIMYDKAYWSSTAMNYPYGENVFFCGGNIFVADILKLSGCHNPHVLIALTTLMVVCSSLLATVFLFLIFQRLKLPWILSALAATGIAFLSPQIARMNAHYNLAYTFAIPAFIWMLLWFRDRPTLKRSILIGLYVFVMSFMHGYYFVFFAGLALFTWFIRDKNVPLKKYIAGTLLQVGIQFILPFLLLQFFSGLGGDAGDRTAYPWGHLSCKTNIAGIFFPFGLYYDQLLAKVYMPDLPSWEGKSFIGIVAILSLPLIVFVFFKRWKKGTWRDAGVLTESQVLNRMCIGAGIMLLYAAAIPFLFNMEWLLAWLGPLRQFRATGRFAWPFYYLVNIVGVVTIWKMVEQSKSLRVAVPALLSLLLLADAWSNNKQEAAITGSELPGFADRSVFTPEEQWMKGLDFSRWQAILPLPYFHIGSENLSRVPVNRNDIIRNSYAVSLKTGLPLFAVSASRTSISQTCDNLSLVYEHQQQPELLNHLPDARPVLVLVTDTTTLTIGERNILAQCAALYPANPGYRVYELSIAAWKAIAANSRDDAERKFTSDSLSGDGVNWVSKDDFIYRNYDDGTGSAFRGKNSHAVIATGPVHIIDEKLHAADGEWRCTWWMNHLREDVFPRTTITVRSYDMAGKELFSWMGNAFQLVQTLDGNWGLLEIRIPPGSTSVQVDAENTSLKTGTSMEFDEVLIFPAAHHVYLPGDELFGCDNRYYTALHQ